ncbi:MAG: tetratricopeptide repeat protein [Bacteroidota bacterium]
MTIFRFFVFCFLLTVLSSQIVVAQDVDNKDVLNEEEQLAAQYFREGNYEKAVVLYQELFEKDPAPVVYGNYLQSLLVLEEFRQAEKVVKRHQENNPGRVRFEIDLGWVYDKAGKNRKANKLFEGLIKDLQADPGAVTDMANAFLFRDYTDYALQTYERGRKLLGEQYPFHISVAEIFSQIGDYQNMMNQYVELIVLDPSQLEKVQGLLQEELDDDPDYTKNQTLRNVLLEKVRENPSENFYAEMLLWLSIQQKDFEMAMRQAISLDRRMKQDGQLVLDVASLSASNQYYDVALRGYDYILQRGDLNPFYLDARTGKLDVSYQKATQSYQIDYDLLREVETEYHDLLDEIGIQPRSVSIIRNLANLKAFYLDDTQGAINILQPVIDMPNVSARVKAECRVEMADILLLNGDLWDAHLLYAQVDKLFKDDPLGHEARFKNARLSFYMGEFKWAKAQLDVLKSATSRLIANDAIDLSLLIQDNLEEEGTSEPLQMFARAQMHTFMNKFDKAIGVLDSITQLFPSHQIIDNVLMEKSVIYQKTGNYEETDRLLQNITEKYPKGLFASKALFMRAQLHETIFEDKEKAMDLYQQIIVDYPGSIYVLDARNNFRNLRGDLLN